MENIEKEGEVIVEPQIYEVSYLVVPTQSSEEAAQKGVDIKNNIQDNNGKVLYEEKIKILDLAYQMSQIISNKKQTYESAYFGCIRFNLQKEKIKNIKDILDKDNDIIRFLIIKTKKEKAQPKPRITRKPFIRKEDVQDGQKKGVNEDELNKKLEGLLTT